eukprot:34008_1
MYYNQQIIGINRNNNINRIIGIANEPLLLMSNFKSYQHGIVPGIFIAIVPLSEAIITYQIYSLLQSISIPLILPLILTFIFSIPLFIYIIYNILKINQITQNKNTNNKFNFIDIKSLMYWLLIISPCAFSVGHHTWNNIKVSFIHHMYGYSYSISSTISTVNSFCGICTV